jgi:NTE family protein
MGRPSKENRNFNPGSVQQMRIVLINVMFCVGLLAGCASGPERAAEPAPQPVLVPRALPQAVPPAVIPAQPKKLGLALGGGAARGFAHIGVIQVLEEAGLKPEVVVGTSAGSLVAALYASGKNGAQLQKLAEELQEAEITDWLVPFFNRGALKGEALAKYVGVQTGQRNMEQFPMRLGVVATDLNSGEPVLFKEGDPATAVRASSAVPTVFLPVKIGSREFVDGGLVSPVPVRFTKQMGADVVLAIDISSPPETNPTGNPVQILLQTTAIMGKSINALELPTADLVVRPQLAGARGTDFSSKRQSIEAGRAAMRAALPRLRQLLGR